MIMKKSVVAAVFAALAVIWLSPVLMNDIQLDSRTIVSALIAAGIFAVAFIACELIGNHYVRFGMTAAAAVVMSVVYHQALFTVVPVMCLNAYRLCLTGGSGTAAPRLLRELLTDLVFAGVILQFVKLFKWGFSPVSAETADVIFPAAFLVILILLVVFDRRGVGEGGFSGVIPLHFNRRTLYILSIVSLILMFLVLFDSRIMETEVVYFNCGVRLLFFPWAMFVFALLGDEIAGVVSLMPEKLARN